MISIIIPVYDVLEFIDTCVCSLVNQTYQDIEIILINDGSTDGSEEKCKAWSRADTRIQYIEKKNEGQAACRNLGVSIAKGDLITFVDADDWVDVTFLQKLYDAMEKYGSDIAICETFTQQSSGKFSENSLQMLDRPIIDIQSEKEYLLTVRYTMWSKLYKKSLFLEHDIIEPAIKFEDFATVPVVFALSNKIACVNECLYYYRYRISSTVHDIKYVGDRIKALDYLMISFQQKGLYESWYEILQRLFMERGLILVRQIYPLLQKNFQIYCDEYDILLKKYFNIDLSLISPHFHSGCMSGNVSANMLGKYNIAVFGSYNLMIVAKILMNLGIPDFLQNHYCFSGLASIMSDADSSFYSIDLLHKSDFRRKHIIQDFTKSFAHKNKSEFDDIDFILIDFLEERFDLGEVNGHYFTLSDAFNDIKNQILIEYRIIDKFSSEARELWRLSCREFITLLKRYFKPEKIIVIKSFLTEAYENDNQELKEFHDISTIKKINMMLKEYYDFFVANMPEVHVIDIDKTYYFTDINFKHGGFPWHLNDKAYWSMRTQIHKLIDEISL